MKPQLLKLSLPPQQSFEFRHDVGLSLFDRWHYHDEIELVYIVQGSGYRFMGDNVSRFESGDMVLIGPGLPHYWQNDDQRCESLTIQFDEDCFGPGFFAVPENVSIRNFLNNAKNGLHILNSTREKVVHLMRQLTAATYSRRIILLLEILECLSVSKDIAKVCESYRSIRSCPEEEERLGKVYRFVTNNLSNDLRLREIASIANLAPNSFCRYFKSRTKKSFSKYLIETRINHACKLLAESTLPIADICYESGFNNFSNFNRHFKNITNSTPLELRKTIVKNA